MNENDLILHVPETGENKYLPEHAVRAGIAEGNIPPSQLVWCAADDVWKPIAQLPHLWPAQKVVTAPVPQVAPKVAASIPMTVKATEAPWATVPQGAARRRSRASSLTPIDEPHLFSYYLAKWVCLALGGVIFIATLINYVMVDRAVKSGLDQTVFHDVPVYSHLGAFLQTGDLVIHIPGSQELNAGNFATFISLVAKSTPSKPFGNGRPFDRVVLTPAWKARYSFSGEGWHELGRINTPEGVSESAKDMILDQLDTASGMPVAGRGASEAVRDAAWKAFMDCFIRS